MIEKIFLNVGMTYSREKLTEKLLHLYDSEFYPSAKTAGAIGGAISQHFLKYDKYTDTYTRIKKWNFVVKLKGMILLCLK